MPAISERGGIHDAEEAAHAAAEGRPTPDPYFLFNAFKDIVVIDSEGGSEDKLLPDLEEKLRAHMTLLMNSENTKQYPTARSERFEKFSIEMGPSVKIDFSLYISPRKRMLELRYPFNITRCDVTVILKRINIRSLNRLEVS